MIMIDNLKMAVIEHLAGYKPVFNAPLHRLCEVKHLHYASVRLQGACWLRHIVMPTSYRHLLKICKKPVAGQAIYPIWRIVDPETNALS